MSIEREFYDEIREKKLLVSSAKHKKNGSKSKKCSLPSDHITQAQWKKMNGGVTVYQLNKPIEWSEFRELPLAIQQEYIATLKERYGMTLKDLSKMFGVRRGIVLAYFAGQNFPVISSVGYYLRGEALAAWKEFLDQGLPLVGADVADEEDEVFMDETEPEKPSSKMNVAKVRLEFNGLIDPNEIANSLRAILGSDCEGRVEIVCDFTEGGVKENVNRKGWPNSISRPYSRCVRFDGRAFVPCSGRC